MSYNYINAMVEDVKEAIKDYPDITLEEVQYSRDEAQEKLYDDLWINDSVTGNGSGSYTFNSYQAKEYIMDNMELCKEALEEFCVDPQTIADKFLCEDFEYFDVTIRCYLLGQAIDKALDELLEEVEA